MKRVIVDYAKLTNEILTLLVEKFPDGYDDSDIIRFKNARNEAIEAVEVRTEDTIYLVKVSLKLADRIENFDDEDVDDPAPDDLEALKDLEIEDDADDEVEESDNLIDAGGTDTDLDPDDDDDDIDDDNTGDVSRGIDDEDDEDED